MTRRKKPKRRSPIQFLSAVEIHAAEGESLTPKFTAVAYTGGPLRVQRYPLPVVIDLAGLEFADSIVANVDHDPLQRVGHITETENDGKQLVLAGLISASGAAAQEVIESGANGFPWKVSVEAQPTSRVQEIAAGRKVEVNGQTFTGPIFVARKSELRGLAFLSRPADENTHVTIAASAANSNGEDSMKFAEYIEAAGFQQDELTDVQEAHLKKTFDAEIKAAKADDPADKPPTIAGPKFDIDELKAAYAGHEASIEAALFKFQGKVDDSKLAEIKASALKSAVELKSKAIENEWASLQFEVEAIKAAAGVELELIRAERPKGPAIHASSHDMNSDVIEAALCMNLGLDVEKDYKEETLDNAHRNFRRIGLQEVFIMAAAANGYAGRQRISPDNLREVLGYALPPGPIHASSFSSVSLSGILSNVANKELLAGFMEEDNSWRELAEIKPVSDFKTVTSYRMLDDMEYQKLGPNGEIEHGKVGQETFTRSADTYARMFALTRTQIINDDLGAFDDVRSRLGRGAARKFRRLFWEKFLNNSSFFTTARGNYFTGAATTLLVDGVGLQTGIEKYRKLKSTDKKQVGKPSASSIGAPSKLVVPPELQHVAEKLHVSGNLSTQQDDNIHRNKYRPIIVNELSDSDYTGNSATGWYLFGSVLMPIVVSLLNGVETPTVDSADADFNQLGVQFRGYHDFGVDLSEWLSGVKSKGAA